jgi:DNA-binding FrmR family transcriptional regulator
MRAIAIERAAAVRHAQRAAGQASAVASMIVERRPFADIAQQLLAARGSLDSLLVRLIELELQECVPNPTARGKVDGLMRSALGHTGASRHAARSPTSESREPRAPFSRERRTTP